MPLSQQDEFGERGKHTLHFQKYVVSMPLSQQDEFGGMDLQMYILNKVGLNAALAAR